ncbi:membrane protein [Actibacterium mucosum KCTC 23349]|uniref:Membrane protein n=1 Tax=Actibacterium mucosum KCTC 23349 TaxID=1454373 RepID=A0A037ZIB1_9RHOB|nr:EI24 domain-containing protein [Actibacterium mucosum]KAJ56185.1 membrane protein [Actibacterium mucosum KCTC 23349]
MILSDFQRAVAQLPDGRFQKVLWLGIGLTLALLFAATVVAVTVLGWFLPDTVTLPWIGTVAWIDNVLSGAVILAMLVMSVFLMVPVASMFTGFFLDEVAAAVEDKHYPGLPPAPSVGFGEVLRDSIGFLGVMLGVNILVGLLVLISLGTLMPLFWLANGYLLGREYFQMVAMRRLGRRGASELRRKHFLTVWIAGTLMAVPLTVPVINLLIPILGVATFTHLYHRVSRL